MAWRAASVIIGSKLAGVINPRSQFPGHVPRGQRDPVSRVKSGAKKWLITIPRWQQNQTDYRAIVAPMRRTVAPFGSYIIVSAFLAARAVRERCLLASRNVTRFDLRFLRRRPPKISVRRYVSFRAETIDLLSLANSRGLLVHRRLVAFLFKRRLHNIRVQRAQHGSVARLLLNRLTTADCEERFKGRIDYSSSTSHTVTVAFNVDCARGRGRALPNLSRQISAWEEKKT